MGTNKEQTYRSVGRKDVHYIPPEELTIITDKTHPLYDDRINLPLNEKMVENIMAVGVKVPVTIRLNGKDKNGDNIIEVVNGRQRTRCALEANKRLRELGEEPIAVPCISEKAGNDEDSIETMVVTNEFAQRPSIMNRATKVKRLLDRGVKRARCAKLLNVSETTIYNYELLLQCCSEVQQAVDSKQIPLDAGKKLAKLSPADQRKALEEMLKAGNKGRAAVDFAENVANGKPPRPPNSAPTTRLRGRQVIERARDSIAPGPKDEPDERMDIANAVLGWVLGDEKALDSYEDIKSKIVQSTKKSEKVEKAAKTEKAPKPKQPKVKKSKTRELEMFDA